MDPYPSTNAPSDQNAASESSTSTTSKLAHCFICGQEILRSRGTDTDTHSEAGTDNPSSWTTFQRQDLSACLCKLFDLAQEDSMFIFIHESYCIKCQELFETISVIYEQLEKLNKELEDKRRIVDQQLRTAYTGSLERVAVAGNQADDSLQPRIQMQKRLLKATNSRSSSSNESTSIESNATIHRNRSCACSCHAITPSATAVKKNVSIMPELVEIKVEPQERSFADEMDNEDLDGPGRGLKKETKPSDESEMLPSTRSRTRLKKNKYSHFFQDSESDAYEGDPSPRSEPDGDEFDPNCDEFGDEISLPKKKQKPCQTQESVGKNKNRESYTAKAAEEPTEKPFCCQLCAKVYFSDRGLRRHMLMFHKDGSSNKQRQYPQKKKASRSRSNTAEAAKDFPCRICGKSCKSSYDLKYHEESHKPDHERRHVCDVCGKGFFKNSVLVKHKRKQHAPSEGDGDGSTNSRDRSLCPICGMHVTQLKTHLRSHTGEKLFSCTICGRSFGTSESVRVHSRIHTGEKPFECATCGMRFRTAQAHRRHKTVHLGEKSKSFVCDHCGKAFRLRQSLREHLHVHTKEAPHRCNICGRRFASTAHLSEHLGSDHTAEQIERKRQNMRRRKGECALSGEIGGSDALCANTNTDAD